MKYAFKKAFRFSIFQCIFFSFFDLVFFGPGESLPLTIFTISRDSTKGPPPILITSPGIIYQMEAALMAAIPHCTNFMLLDSVILEHHENSFDANFHVRNIDLLKTSSFK